MDGALLAALRERALPLRGPRDLDPLLERIGDARFVLLGESTHGTHEFYAERARLTRRLIEEKDFSAVAVEGDGPDAHRVDRFVRGRGQEDEEAIDALGDFRRFPAWMWRNADVLDLVGWLRSHNERVDPERRVGFHGLDLYAMHAAMRAVVAWLDAVDPAGADRARRRYGCFEDFGADPHDYGAHAGFGIRPDCGPAVTDQLVDLLRTAGDRRGEGSEARDDDFFALQCARLVIGAEAYYKAAFGGRATSWNLRDAHLCDTLDRIAEHLADTGRPAKVVVWAHNSHVGDARASDMGRTGELSLGQLCRERHGAETFVVGFSTHHGTVTAADGWDRPAGRMAVRPAAPDSYEDLLHGVGLERFLLDLADLGEAAGGLAEERFERAIGVVYRPATERWSHLFRACLPRRFDALIHVDETRAVEPLERTSRWEAGELPETFPSAL